MVDYHADGNLAGIYGEGLSGGINHEIFDLGSDPTKITVKDDPFKCPVTADQWPQLWKHGQWNELLARIVGNAPKITTWISAVRFMDLTKALSGMGLAALFATETADLSGIATDAENLYVQGVLQAVRLEVDEAGTRLAAATSVKGGFGGAAREVTVTADHPFLFFVRDTRTGAVLVLGRLVE